MSSTNKTVTIELSQYVGTDKPTYLSDYNGDMLKIDTAIAADRDSIATAQNTADNASLKADTNTESISTLNETVNGSGTGLAPRLTNLESTVNTINELIGNGEPTTTDKTLIGAINEIDSDVTTLNNTVNGTYLPLGIDIEIARITADGVKTNKELIDELHAAVGTYKATLADNVKFRYSRIKLGTGSYNANWETQLIGKNDSHYATLQNFAAVGTLKARQANFDGNCAFWLEDDIDGNGYTSTNQLTIVPSSGAVFVAYVDIYKIV